MSRAYVGISGVDVGAENTFSKTGPSAPVKRDCRATSHVASNYIWPNRPSTPGASVNIYTHTRILGNPIHTFPQRSTVTVESR